MSAPEFLDTNVLIYAYDVSDPVKQGIAQRLLSRAVAGEIVASTQVLAEFATTLLHKLSPPVPVEADSGCAVYSPENADFECYRDFATTTYPSGCGLLLPTKPRSLPNE